MTTFASIDQSRDADLLFGQALLAHRWERRYAEAETLYQKALTADAGLVPCRIWYAILLTKLARPEDASEQLQQAIQSDAALTAQRLHAAREQSPKDDAIQALCGLFESLERHKVAANKPGPTKDPPQADMARQEIQPAKPTGVSSAEPAATSLPLHSAPGDLETPVPTAIESILCPICGKSIRANAKFCRYCGASLAST